MAKLSTELQRFFFDEERPSQITLTDILLLAGERVFGFLFVILSFPSALPVPAPGYSTPFGVVIFLLALQLIKGDKTPWIPRKWVHHPIDLKMVQGVLKAGLPWLRRIEILSRPRLTSVCTSLVGRTVIGLGVVLCGISMMIPIPGTNTLPAIGIFVTGFGLLEDDGAVSLAGLAICLMGVVLTTSILIALFLGGSSLLDLLRG
jgi:hypothetical protein